MKVNHETALKIKRHYEEQLIGKEYNPPNAPNGIIKELVILPNSVINHQYYVAPTYSEQYYEGNDLGIVVKFIRHIDGIEEISRLEKVLSVLEIPFTIESFE